MVGAAIAVLAIVALLGRADTAHASFNPTYELTIVDTQAGAHSDVTTEFNLPKGDVQFGGAVFFIPPEWGITPGDEIPIGAVVGELIATATLGLINSACFNELPVGFTMLNASIDPSDTVIYLDTEEDDPEAEGYSLPDYFEDRDGSGLQDGIEKYPDFITRVLDDIPGDEVGNPLTPIRRSAGISVVAGTEVLLQFLVFEPGTFINENISNDPDLGYPSVTLLQNAGDPATDPIPGPITDFCTALTSNNTSYGVSKDNTCIDAPGTVLDPICEVNSAERPEEGQAASNPDESGVPLSTNPPEGTYPFTIIAAGQRDADGDGIENTLDTCAFIANAGDPRIGGDGDVDEDGLDTACDPDDNNINSDEDLDGYLNRQDNCPLVPNGEDGTNQRDSDDDAVGDDCDPDPDDRDAQGELILAEVSTDVTIGPGGSPTQETPTADQTPTPADEDDGGGSSAIVFIIIGVVVAVVVLGGGGYYFMRRGRA